LAVVELVVLVLLNLPALLGQTLSFQQSHQLAVGVVVLKITEPLVMVVQVAVVLVEGLQLDNLGQVELEQLIKDLAVELV
jgi:hypothetical protein